MTDAVACRIFVGDLGNEVNDDVLQKSFQKYTTLLKAKVVRDKRTNKTKGQCSSSVASYNTLADLYICESCCHQGIAIMA